MMIRKISAKEAAPKVLLARYGNAISRRPTGADYAGWYPGEQDLCCGQMVIGASRNARARSRPCPPAPRPSLRSSTDTPGPAAAHARGPLYGLKERASLGTSRTAAW